MARPVKISAKVVSGHSSKMETRELEIITGEEELLELLQGVKNFDKIGDRLANFTFV